MSLKRPIGVSMNTINLQLPSSSSSQNLNQISQKSILNESQFQALLNELELEPNDTVLSDLTDSQKLRIIQMSSLESTFDCNHLIEYIRRTSPSSLKPFIFNQVGVSIQYEKTSIVQKFIDTGILNELSILLSSLSMLYLTPRIHNVIFEIVKLIKILATKKSTRQVIQNSTGLIKNIVSSTNFSTSPLKNKKQTIELLNRLNYWEKLEEGLFFSRDFKLIVEYMFLEWIGFNSRSKDTFDSLLRGTWKWTKIIEAKKLTVDEIRANNEYISLLLESCVELKRFGTDFTELKNVFELIKESSYPLHKDLVRKVLL